MRLSGNILLPAFGVLIIALVVIAIIFRDKTKRVYLGQFSAPILALELAQSGEEIRTLLREVNEDEAAARKWFRKGLEFDNKVFIPIYFALLTVCCALLFRHNFANAKPLAVIAFTCVAAGAACDYLEKHHIARVLNTESNLLSDAMADAIRTPSLWKWGLIFFALLPLSSMFFMNPNRWRALAGLAFLIGSLCGLYGLINRVYVEKANLPILLGLLLSAILFVVSSRSFLEAMRNPLTKEF